MELHPDGLIGAVRLRSQWNFYAGVVAEWTLDYARRDPEVLRTPEGKSFRGGLATVDVPVADRFCEVMSPYRLTIADLHKVVREVGGPQAQLAIVVDFDRKHFISSYYDQPLEQYVPKGWSGVLGSPLDYLPAELQELWRHHK
jgi:hypothetical protein